MKPKAKKSMKRKVTNKSKRITKPKITKTKITKTKITKTKKTSKKAIKPLNNECLRHISQYLAPTAWIPFTKVCQAWKEAVFVSKESRKLAYITGFSYCHARYERLTFPQFLEILEFVAPILECLEISKNVNKRVKFSVSQLDVSVSFGSFVYVTRVKEDEEKLVMDVLLKKTQNVEKLKLNTFHGAKQNDWETFFKTNPLKYFRFLDETSTDHGEFYDNYISILPNSLEQVGLMSSKYQIDGFFPKIEKFLAKLPRLTKLHLTFQDKIPSWIAKLLTKHAKTLEKLCLMIIPPPSPSRTHCSFGGMRNPWQERRDWINEERTKVLSVLPKCTKLKKLHLRGFQDDNMPEKVCKQIVTKCHSIQHLKILSISRSYPSVDGLKLLMQLPLKELHIDYENIELIPSMTDLKKLVVINCGYRAPDFESLANALTEMPSLSTLIWDKGYSSLTDTAAKKIKKIILSRGKNIAVYLMKDAHRGIKFESQKIGEIMCEPASNEEFKIMVYGGTPGGVNQVLDVLTKN